MHSGDLRSRQLWYYFYQFPGELMVNGSTITIQAISFTFEFSEGHFLIPNYPLLRELIRFNRLTLSKEGSSFYATIDKIKVKVQSPEEVFILHEVYTAGCYNITLPTNKCLVIDIGMNAGFTSLYFAGRPEVEHIYSFEPFLMTLNEARANLALNPTVANKITPYPFGLSDTDKNLEVSYNFDDKGKMGVMGADRVGISENITSQSITLKRASTVIADLCSRHPQLPVIVKIDCEGSEYEIIDDLCNSGFPATIKAIAIEWHEKGHDKMKKQLTAAGFTVFAETPMNLRVGMMYAFRP